MQPPNEPVDDGTTPARPATVLQEHWARERAALIAERAALLAERELLLAQRAALSGSRELSPAADTAAESPGLKRSWFGRRKGAAAIPADAASDPATATPDLAGPSPLGPRHAVALDQPDGPSADEQVDAVEPADLQIDEPLDEPVEPQIDDPAEVDGEADAHAPTGWSRRSLGWLLAPAEQPEQPEQPQQAMTEASPPTSEDDEEPAPQQQGLPPYRLRPDVEPASAASAAKAAPQREPGADAEPDAATTEPVVESQGLPPYRLRPDVEPPAAAPAPAVPELEPAAAVAAKDVEPPREAPATDLPRRLAAANAAAMARALASQEYEFPEDDEDDSGQPRQRQEPAAFVRPSGPRPAGIARDDESATTTSVGTGTAVAKRNVAPPSDVDDDDDETAAAKPHRVTVRGTIRLLIVVVIAAVIATLLRVYVVAPYYIPSASMEPTLHGCLNCNNDHVLVDKLSYKMHDIHRGDVVVFNRPQSWQVSEKVLIKRVIGLPGDTLTAKDGIVYIDGLALDEPYLFKGCSSGTTSFPTTVTVPDGQAFVMGDNRCDSSDSRKFGAIPDAKVIGRAFMIIWPFGRLHWL